MSNKYIGYQTVLSVCIAGDDTTYVTIGNLLSLDLPQLNADEVDTSGLNDTFKDYNKSIIDLGLVKAKVAYSPEDDGHETLVTLMLADNTAAIPNWKVTFPKANAADTAPVHKFVGFVKSLGTTGISRDGAVTTEFTIRVRNSHGYAISD